MIPGSKRLSSAGEKAENTLALDQVGAASALILGFNGEWRFCPFATSVSMLPKKDECRHYSFLCKGLP
jgi:hypothetical protein